MLADDLRTDNPRKGDMPSAASQRESPLLRNNIK